MKIYTTSQARDNLFKLVNAASTSHEPVCIIGKHGEMVMITKDDYDAMQETLYLLNISGMRESILAADKEPIEKCKKTLDW